MESQINIAVDKILRQRFLALDGPSGSGKSSLINAGIIPALKKRGSWLIITVSPGKNPVKNLSHAISEIANRDRSQSKETENLLRDHPDKIIEFLLQVRKANENILIVIDPFEELLNSTPGRSNDAAVEEIETFSRILAKAKESNLLPLHVIIAIRNEFLDSAKHFSLLELIDESSLTLPRISYAGLKKVIRGPADLAGIKIESGLENRLLDDISENQDYLPLLQHMLNRMCKNRITRGNYEKAVLTLDDYEEAGKTGEAINLYADRVYMDLPDREKQICEKIFKSITEKNPDNLEIPVPLSVSELAFITHSTIPEIIRVVEKFRKQGFLSSSSYGSNEPEADTIVTLSHESLMRLWKRLQVWIDEEAWSVFMYKQLAEASRLYQMGKNQLLSRTDLKMALEWKEKNEPGIQWAQRHNTAFERTMQFINKSYEAHEINEFKKLEKSRRSTLLMRVITFLVILFLLALAGVVMYTSGWLPGLNSVELVQDDMNSEEISEGDHTLASNSDSDELPSAPDTSTQQDQALTEAAEALLSEAELQEETITITGEDHLSDMPEPADIAENGTLEDPMETTPADTFLAEVPENAIIVPSEEEFEPEPEVPSEPDVDEPEVNSMLRQRIVETSHSLAEASLQIHNNPDLKALLASQSYIFNDHYNESSYNPDILRGLLSAMLNLYGESYNVHTAHTESVNSVLFRPNSNIFYSASSDGQVLRWNLGQDNMTPDILIRNPVINNLLAVSDDGIWLAVATDGNGIQLFNISVTGTSPIQVSWGNNRIIAMDFHPDNEHILFAGSDNYIVKYHIRSQTSEIIAESGSEILTLAVSPDGSRVATGTRSGQVVVYNEDDGYAPETMYNDPGNDILAISYNMTGSRIATGNISGEVRIINTSNGSILATFEGHSARVADLAFCPANRLIASSSFDGSIRIWDSQNPGVSPVVINQNGSWVRSLAFNSEGSRLVTGSRQENRLRVWITNPGDMASRICERLTRNLTQSEWNQFIGEDIPYMESCPQLSNR